MKGYLSGNRITLLKNGAEYFPALEAVAERLGAELRATLQQVLLIALGVGTVAGVDWLVHGIA